MSRSVSRRSSPRPTADPPGPSPSTPRASGSTVSSIRLHPLAPRCSLPPSSLASGGGRQLRRHPARAGSTRGLGRQRLEGDSAPPRAAPGSARSARAPPGGIPADSSAGASAAIMSSLRLPRHLHEHARDVHLAQLDRRTPQRAHDRRGVAGIAQQAHPREHVARARTLEERALAASAPPWRSAGEANAVRETAKKSKQTGVRVGAAGRQSTKRARPRKSKKIDRREVSRCGA